MELFNVKAGCTCTNNYVLKRYDLVKPLLGTDYSVELLVWCSREGAVSLLGAERGGGEAIRRPSKLSTLTNSYSLSLSLSVVCRTLYFKSISSSTINTFNKI